eukprot:9420322-Alexandrium_andersonii.AAC.1
MARALNLMVAANLSVTDGVWNDIRVAEATVDTFALHRDAGSLALAKRPRQLGPVGSVTLLAPDEGAVATDFPICRELRGPPSGWRV